MKIVPKIQNIMLVESYNIKAYSNIHNQTGNQQILFWVPVHFFKLIFSALEIKKIVLVDKILWRYIVAYMVNLFVVSLDMTAMINILQEMMKILQEKMLKVINLYWLLNDATEKTNSLNDHPKEPWTNL